VAKGAALHALGRNEEALVALEKATSLDPNNADIWHNKGALLWGLGRKREAEEAERRARTLGG
jgi:Flp pilus assembly protein TadD